MKLEHFEEDFMVALWNVLGELVVKVRNLTKAIEESAGSKRTTRRPSSRRPKRPLLLMK